MSVASGTSSNIPALSVVMPVHDALPHLDAAIRSILEQTQCDFEFVILDDASRDGSAERLRWWAAQDGRIRLLHSDENLGPAVSSQRVAAAALAPIVARMDADDISHPERLQAELAVLDRHPEAGVVACLCDFIDVNGKNLRGSERWRLSRRSLFVPFAHGAMMYRRSVFEQVGGYRPETAYWEDQDLVTRMAAVASVLVIPRSLYTVRLSRTSTRAASHPRTLEQAVDLMYRCTDNGTRYDHVLEAPPKEREKVDPRVFISLGSQLLWAGGKPRMFSRLVARGKLGLNRHTGVALVWTGWASASPGTLRLFLRLLVGLRNRLASRPSEADEPVVWPGT